MADINSMLDDCRRMVSDLPSAAEHKAIQKLNADMLAALKGVLGIARAATMHSGGEHNRKRIAAAEAAIAKAEAAS